MSQTFPSPLLVVEASSSAGSVALFIDGALLSERDVAMGPAREDAILPAIADLLKTAGIAPRDVRAIACGNGPGSFTSLRIAASLAKGIAVANNAELFAVPSLLLAAAALHDQPGEYVLHADALRGERYVVRVQVIAADIIDDSSASRVADGAFVNATPVSTTFTVVMSNVNRMLMNDVTILARDTDATLVAVGAESKALNAAVEQDVGNIRLIPRASNVQFLRDQWRMFGPVDVAAWEPEYGRLAEAQVKWETQHGRELPTG